MSDPLIEEDDASTPLTRKELADLIPTYIVARRELNEVEQSNIIEAEAWAFSRKRDVLTERVLLDLHKRMFGRVWRWAGKFRKTERNIGVEPWRIGVELAQLLNDICFWIEQKTYSVDEIAARFHHRLVWIHPFANGNGRHARMATDLLLVSLGAERFSWGSENLVDASKTRRDYVTALRAADTHDLTSLLAFIRS
jgi:Fic-DOC domain mobile mystery protein B